MIAFVKGKIVSKSPTQIVIDIGGLGYEIQISLHTYSAIAELETCQLHTCFHFNEREGTQVLYGFNDLAEKNLFLHLISVNGVGKNTARNILSYANPTELQQAIVNNQVALIQKIKGIGAKTAQRLVLELKDKLLKAGFEQTISSSPSNKLKDEALLALTNLGIPKNQAEKQITKVLNSNSNASLEELIKSVLQNI